MIRSKTHRRVAAWPSVGVVIATRNRPMLLRRALTAVLAQAYPGPIHVAIVHDQAEPDVALAAGGDRPVTVLMNQRTPGLTGARNTGVLALATELVAFCHDDDVWAPEKLQAQVAALTAAAGAEVATCATELEYDGRRTPRLAGLDRIDLADLTRARLATLPSSTFLIRRAALVGPDRIGLLAEDAPGNQNQDWDLLLRAARRAPIAHVDEPLVRMLWRYTSPYSYEYTTKISSLRWIMARHPQLESGRPEAARVYGRLACWSAASGNRRAAWHWTKQTVRQNWREPRAAIALAALSGAVRIERLLATLHRRGHLV
ncbi:glycosyltransferase family 2 protein [Natronosporangium hydrolyticum]|uniref:glycosyltransferase family 2 protein n=1 Tax=Natronosporangium hydrolyticum TaxID=2811111 RepID=UPI001EFA0CDE|nr:glycosyltransferase family A protein [Natronosporangium hydrolyticum]